MPDDVQAGAADPPRRAGARLRAIATAVLVLALAIFGLLLLVVVVGHGFNVRVGPLRVQSTMAELPLLGLLVSLLLLLLIRDRWREALLLMASLVVAGGLVEIALRVIDHPWSRPEVRWFLPSARYGHELRPGFVGRGPRGVPIEINSQGFRDREHTREKPPGTIRILGLGDSFTFGWGVPAERAFLHQAEQLLAQWTGKRVEAINAGVPGWGLNQYYLYLRDAGIEYQPDVIALAYFVDDLSVPILEQIPPSPQHLRPPVRGGALAHSRLFNFVQALSSAIAAKNRPTRVAHLRDLGVRRRQWLARPNLLLAEQPLALEVVPRDTLRDYLVRIQLIAEQHHAMLVIMMIPEVSQLHHPETQHINHVLMQLASDLAIPFVDMTPRFEQVPDLRTYYLWPEDPHVNGKGHDEMARALAGLICRADTRGRLGCGREGRDIPVGDRVTG